MPRNPVRLGIAIAAFVAAISNATAQDPSPPVWATPDRFWFRVTVQGGYEWWKVDAAHSMREPLFDHRRLATELNQQAKREYSPLGLPFADPAAAFIVKYDGSNAALQEGALAIEFRLPPKHDEQWRCELQGEWDWGRTPPSDYYCESQGDIEPASGAGTTAASPAISPDGKWEALIQNYNVAVRQPAGAIRMLSTDGTAADGYHMGSLRWSRDSRTVSAYRVHSNVWLQAPVAGSVSAQLKKQDWSIEKIEKR